MIQGRSDLPQRLLFPTETQTTRKHRILWSYWWVEGQSDWEEGMKPWSWLFQTFKSDVNLLTSFFIVNCVIIMSLWIRTNAVALMCVEVSLRIMNIFLLNVFKWIFLHFGAFQSHLIEIHWCWNRFWPLVFNFRFFRLHFPGMGLRNPPPHPFAGGYSVTPDPPSPV